MPDFDVMLFVVEQGVANVLEDMENMGEDVLIKLISCIATVLSAGAVVGSVATHMRSKSYEVLIQHRLESLDSIRKDFAKLTYYFSLEGIEKLKRSCSLEDYNAYVIKTKCNMKMQMKVFDDQEALLFHLIDRIHQSAQSYFAGQVEDEDNETEEKFEEKFKSDLKRLDIEYAIYDWTMWRYHQRLHERNANYTKIFNKMHKKMRKEVEKIEYEKAMREKILGIMSQGDADQIYGVSDLRRECWDAQGKVSWFQTRKRLEHMEGLGLVRNVEKLWWKRAISPQYKKVSEENWGMDENG